MTKIIVDPMVNIYYASFYVYALIKLFGKRKIFFKNKPFNHFNNDDRIKALNFIIVQGNKEEKRYTINFDDSYKVKKDLFEWCDVYGNVNANFEKTSKEFHSKMVSLCPSFGIRILNTPGTFSKAIINYLKIAEKESFRKFMGKYKRQLKLRLPYEFYETREKVRKNYIFHLSTLWYSDEWNKNDEGVNLSRFNFIKTCKSIDFVNFEGGLSVNPGKKNNSNFASAIYEGTIFLEEYLKKVKQSVLVFNTPAFWSCHGWKLGEYLALGKAIISTPLSNDLPVPLIHGENIHLVENSIESIKEAIFLILNDEAYRIKLENGARKYWSEYGEPIKSLNLLGIENK